MNDYRYCPAFRPQHYADNLDAILHALARADRKKINYTNNQTSKLYLLRWSYFEISRLRAELQALKPAEPRAGDSQLPASAETPCP